MSRQLSTEFSRSIRKLDPVNSTNIKSSTNKKHISSSSSSSSSSTKLSPQGFVKAYSPHLSSYRPSTSQNVCGSPRPSIWSEEETQSSGQDLDDLDQRHIPGIKLPVPTKSMYPNKSHKHSNKKALKATSIKKDRNRGERKALVRKERFEELESDSDLTEVPSSDDNVATVSPLLGRLDKGKAKSLDDSDSDTEMEIRLLAAGDGESLLGSGGSGEEDDQEEQYLIRETLEREARAKAKTKTKRDLLGDNARGHGDNRDRGRKADHQHRARSLAIHHNPLPGSSAARYDGQPDLPAAHPNSYDDNQDADIEDDDDDNDDDEPDDPDDDLLSLSPATMRIYGLPVIEDELFEEQPGFHTSSEPSFTDFFESSTDSESISIPGVRNDDDDEFTTDSDQDDDISDLEAGVLDVPLIAHVGVPQVPENIQAGQQVNPNTEVNPDMPLLVIEDLDGRLIYARAGDGEAVFGSDGEFEFVDDSEDDSTDWEHDEHGNRLWPLSDSAALLRDDDDGDTTDELPDEDMPYPRLLVGSVAPRGGRNSRRARALAAKSRRLSPSVQSNSALLSPASLYETQLTVADDAGDIQSLTCPTQAIEQNSPTNSPQDQNMEIDITISTEALARDPEGTLKAAAQALGVSIREAASLIAGVQIPAALGDGNAVNANSDQMVEIKTEPGLDAKQSNNAPLTKAPNPDPVAHFLGPKMGSFMPTSAKAVHRAVIDGSRKAPSPFSDKRSLEKRGLTKKRTAGRRSTGMQSSSKRLRRLSANTLETASAVEEFSELAASSPEPEPMVDPMDLDDVVDSNMLWRANSSKSPSLDGLETEEDKASLLNPNSSDSTHDANVINNPPFSGPGLNFNAFARWHKIPMGTFRDSQGSQSPFHLFHQQPLGTFLLTRSQGSGHRRDARSPFRSSSSAARNPEMFSISPIKNHNGPANSDTTLMGANQSSSRTQPFVISPVLFPTRGGEIPLSANSSHHVSNSSHHLDNPRSDQSFSNNFARTTSLPQGLPSGIKENAASNHSAGPGRITRREKRARKAQRAALRVVTKATEGDETRSVVSAQSEPSRSPHPATPPLLTDNLTDPPVETIDSPASAFPKMRITDATPTPRGSPTPSVLSGMYRNSFTDEHGSPKYPLNGSNLNATSRHLDDGSMTLDGLPTPPPLMSLEKVDHLSTALPSSACKTPLHSPLFGGIFGGGFHDDLDDKDGENVLRI